MRRLLSLKRNKFPIAFSLLAILLLLQSCGNQESWVYKQWHNTLAHYNKFFNAEQKWLETYDQTRENFKDDPRRPLSLFNYGDVSTLKGNLAAMDEVIKKASTMIDRHPRSRWVDDAYLLNGKAYFLKGEITAAENLFTYVIDHFKDPIPIHQAQLWTVRCLVMKKRVADADVLLNTLIKKPEFPKELLTEAHFLQGAIQIELGKYGQAIKPLEEALPHVKQRIDKYRVHFALGECYLKEKEYLKAEVHFAKIARFNPPYEIAFRAKMAQVAILSEQQENYTKANVILGRMLKDEKNIDFLGTIYISMGNNELKAKRDAIAIKRYQQAVMVSTDKVQKSNGYLSLGDYFFNRKQYAISAKYFDSANAIIDEKHPNFAAIAAKNDILSDLLKEVLTFTGQDSLLKMANDANWRSAKIAEAIAREKAEAQKAAERAAQMSKTNNASTGFPGNPDFAPMNGGGGGMATAGQSSFPFYNPAQRLKGKQDFERMWGKRENLDYWRYSNRKTNLEDVNSGDKKSGDGSETGDGSTASNGGGNGSAGGNANSNNGGNGKTGKNTGNDGKTAAVDTLSMPKNIPPDEKKYYTGLPFSGPAKKIALEKIEKSEFAAAQIYQNRLNEPNSALELYTNLIQRFPNSELSPQAHYEIIKIARSTGDYALADQYKSKLITSFPKSIYVRMLESGQTLESISTGNNKLIDSLVSQMGNAYKAEKYEEVAKLKQQIDKDYAGNQQQAQIDFIYASSVIRSGDKVKGISLMEQVGSDYPTDPIGLRAKDVVEAYKKMEDAKKISAATGGGASGAAGTSNTATTGTVTAGNMAGTVNASLYKKWDNKEELTVVFAVPKGTNVNLTRSILSDFNKKNFSFETGLEITPAMPMGSYSVIVIRNFSKPVEAQKYADIVKNSGDIFLAKGIMEYQCKPISMSNYVVLNRTLDFRGYLDFPGE